MLIDKEDAKKAICEVCYMYKYIGDEYKECRYYPCDDIKALEAIPSAEQVTSKLKKHCDSLLTEDSEERKEHKSKLESAEAVQGYTEWLEKIIVEAETFEWLCEDTTDKEWCVENCNYSSIQAECLRHLYEVSKGGDDE